MIAIKEVESLIADLQTDKALAHYRVVTSMEQGEVKKEGCRQDMQANPSRAEEIFESCRREMGDIKDRLAEARTSESNWGYVLMRLEGLKRKAETLQQYKQKYQKVKTI